MLDTTLDLWRTTAIIWTIPRSLALVADQWGAAFRTTLNKLNGLGDDGALIDIHTNNFGDNLATLLYIYVVANMQVETLDKILVVKGGALNCCACQLYRIHVGHRGDSTSTAHLIGNLVQAGANTLGLELISDGPTWTLGCKA